jgi:hypothetical protein
MYLVKTHRFILEPYKGKTTRHNCPSCKERGCFSRYIDTDKIIEFPNHVGRCNRENNCGYHFTPKQYFEQNPEKAELIHDIQPRSQAVQQQKPSLISFIDESIVSRSLTRYDQNKLCQFLTSVLGEEQTLKLMKQYRVGTANYWPGATIFWQTDSSEKVRTGKIMLYDPSNGRRIKKPHNHISWVHSMIGGDEFNLKQCFFGEHLLNQNKTLPFAIVESEKSALIASYYLPEFCWIASGGKYGCFKDENLTVLEGRKIVLFPDLGAFDQWNLKANHMQELGYDVEIFDYLERNASEKQRREGYDIADFLLQIQPEEVNLQMMINKNPMLKKLIDHFELALEKDTKTVSENQMYSQKRNGIRL